MTELQKNSPTSQTINMTFRVKGLFPKIKEAMSGLSSTNQTLLVQRERQAFRLGLQRLREQSSQEPSCAERAYLRRVLRRYETGFSVGRMESSTAARAQPMSAKTSPTPPTPAYSQT